MFKKYILDILSWTLAIVLLLSGDKKNGVFFLDVGQGDAILIQKDNVQILIDGGEDMAALHQLAKYMPYGDMNIELVVLTHPHSDHLNGLFHIFERYSVGEVWFNDIDCDTAIYEYFLSLDIPKKEAHEGSIYSIGQWELKVLFASDSVYEKDFNINNASIVLELDTEKYKYLFMGDAEIEEEKYLIEKNILNDVDILKAGHHCSKTASSEIFLDTVKPEIAICSYGEDNRFGHPHEETMGKFKTRNIQVHSTAEEGNICVL